MGFSRTALKVEKVIAQKGLLCSGERILVAVSGGPDSVALIHILDELSSRWRWTLAIGHVNHGLRPEGSKEDEEFVKRLAEQLGVEFLLRRIPEGSLRVTRGSLQERARDERYRLLEEMRNEFRAGKIALGHTCDDQAETVLAALGRGAGTRGLGAMRSLTGVLVRPLLGLPRQEIIAYLEERAIPYRMDPSNEDIRFLRVRIRKELIPYLRRTLNPMIATLLCRTAEICSIDDDYLHGVTKEAWSRIALNTGAEVTLNRSLYGSLHKALRYRLLRMGYEAVRGNTRRLELSHVEDMDTLSVGNAGEKWLDLPGKVRFGVSGDLLIFAPVAPECRTFSYALSVPGKTDIPEAGMRLNLEVVDATDRPWGGPLRTLVALDMDKIQPPLVVRSPRPGDRLRPKGLNGTKKLQDLLVDLKVPRRERWKVPVVEDCRGVIWVVGLKVDERVIPDQDTKKILLAQVEPLSS